MARRIEQREVTHVKKEDMVIVTCDKCGHEEEFTKYGVFDQTTWTLIEMFSERVAVKHLCGTCTEKHITPLFRPLVLEDSAQ